MIIKDVGIKNFQTFIRKVPGTDTNLALILLTVSFVIEISNNEYRILKVALVI